MSSSLQQLSATQQQQLLARFPLSHHFHSIFCNQNKFAKTWTPGKAIWDQPSKCWANIVKMVFFSLTGMSTGQQSSSSGRERQQVSPSICWSQCIDDDDDVANDYGDDDAVDESYVAETMRGWSRWYWRAVITMMAITRTIDEEVRGWYQNI